MNKLNNFNALFIILLVFSIVLPFHASASLVHAAADTNLIPNPSFETEDGWDVTFKEEASGTFERDEAMARTGNHSMKLSKDNGLGYVRLTSSEPIQVEAGKEYTFRGYFHSEDAPISSLLLFRVADKNDERLAYDDIDKSAGYTSQSMLINSSADHWEKRVINFKAEEDQEIYLHVVLYGNPATVWLDDLEFTSEPYEIPSSQTSDFSFPYTEEQVLQILNDRENVTASVDTTCDAAKLMINGEPSPTAIYKGLESNKQNGDEEQFGKDGIDKVVTKVNLGPVYYDHVWKGEGEYDFEVMEEAIMASLKKNPHANIIVDFWIYPYETWGEENIDEVKQNIDGEWAYGTTFNIAGYTDDISSLPSSNNKHWYYPSYQSDKWKQDAGEAIRQSIEHLKTTDLWKSVMGIYLTSGHDGRITPHDYDYSEPSQAGFREWLEEEYENVSQLNKVWNASYENFSQVTVPANPAGASMEASNPTLEKGAVTDYMEYKEKGTWEYRDYFAKVVKETSDKPVITMAYGKNSPNFLKTEYLDASGTMTHYPSRNPGYSAAWRYGTPHQLKSKLMFQELDMRSWSGSRYDEVYQMWTGAGLTPDSWESINKKLVGSSLANGYGYWYYDMNQYYNAPEIHERIASSYDVVEKVYNRPNNLKSDVVVVSTGTTTNYLGSDYNAVVPSVYDYGTMMLETSGVPYDRQYLEDILENPELRDYKIYIFPNEAYISSEEREKINDLLKKDENILVWQYNTGYVSDYGKSVENITDLVGIDVVTKEEYTRLTPQMKYGSHSLTDGVMPFQGSSELYLNKFTLKGRTPFVARYQPFWIEDDESTTLATYAENDRSAMALKEFDDWTSIYLGAPNSLGNDLLNNLATEVNAYVIGEAGHSINMNSNFVSLHGMQTGPYTMQLPEGKSRVIEAETGEILADGVSEYTFDVEAQKTYWFILEESSSSFDMKALVEKFEEEGAFVNQGIARALKVHLMAVKRFELKNATTKVVKHMNGFNQLLDNQKENEHISEDAYGELKYHADALIQKMMESLLQMDVQLQEKTAVAGETVQIQVQLENVSEEPIKDSTLTVTWPEELSVDETNDTISQIEPGQTVEKVFEMKVPEAAEVGIFQITTGIFFKQSGVDMGYTKEKQLEISPLLEANLITDQIRVNKAGNYPVSFTVKSNANQSIEVELDSDSPEKISLDLNSPTQIESGRTMKIEGNLHISNDVKDGDYNVAIQTSVDGIQVNELPFTVSIHKNMVRNPGFEDGNTAPDYWTMQPNAEWVQDEVHSGNYALSMTPGKNIYTLYRYEVPVTPGKTYQASYWAKNDSTNGGEFGIRRIDANRVTIDYLWEEVERESDWTQYSFEFTPTEETEFVSVYFRLKEEHNGQMWFDDISIEEVVESN